MIARGYLQSFIQPVPVAAADICAINFVAPWCDMPSKRATAVRLSPG